MSARTASLTARLPRGAAAGWTALAVVVVLAPFYLTEIELFTAARVVIIALWAISLNLLLGQTGIVSFAHAAYFGVGAYTVALLWQHLEWTPLVGIPLSIPVGAAIAFLTGLVAFRAVRLYFALLTLALSQLIYVVVFQWYDFTGGDNGIHGIETPAFLDSTVNAYWLVAAVAAIGIAALWAIGRSPFGAALQAIRENRLRASFIGIAVKRHELAAFTIAGAFGALAGALFAIFNREAYPNLLFWTANATPIFVVLIGGMHRFVGPIVGAVVFVLLEETVTRETAYSDLILGSILLAIVLVAPGGLTDLAQGLWRRLRGGRKAAEEPEPRPEASEAALETRT